MFNSFRALLAGILIVLSGCSSLERVQEDTAAIQGEEKYLIRTRIVVEEMGDRSARSYGDITRDIARAEQIFEGLGIDFIVVEMALARPNQEWYAYAAQDAAKYPDTLSIYYTFWRPPIGRNMPAIIGMGALPFGTPSLGVFVYGPSMDNNTLAHEIGHYFGLLHTFENREGGDFVDDTHSRQEYADLNGEDADYMNYANVMNYHYSNVVSTITPGQEERVRYYLNRHRKGHVLTDRDIRQEPLELEDPVTIEWEKSDVEEGESLESGLRTEAGVRGRHQGVRGQASRSPQEPFAGRFHRCSHPSCSSGH